MYFPTKIFLDANFHQKKLSKNLDLWKGRLKILEANVNSENINDLLNKKGFDKLKLNYNKFNILNTYMGAQCFESWGLVAMTNYALKNKNKTQDILRLAVKRMLPGGPLAKKQLTKLKVYSGSDHPHSAQNPEVIEIGKLNSKNIVRN